MFISTIYTIYKSTNKIFVDDEKRLVKIDTEDALHNDLIRWNNFDNEIIL